MGRRGGWTAGYGFGETIFQLFGHIHELERYVVPAIIGAGPIFAFILHRRSLRGADQNGRRGAARRRAANGLGNGREALADIAQRPAGTRITAAIRRVEKFRVSAWSADLSLSQ